MLDTTSKILANICNGEIDIIFYDDEYFTECEDVFIRAFLSRSTVCTILEMSKPEQLQARKDLAMLFKEIAKDGVSLLAKDRQTDRIVSFCFNKILVKNNNFLRSFVQNICEHEKSKLLVNFIIESDETNNLFEKFQINCLFELFFLGTLPEYGQRGIGKTIMQYSLQLASDLKGGFNLHLLPETLKSVRPQLGTAIFTSKFSQKISKDLNFEVVSETFYRDIMYEGKSFAERIGGEQVSSILCIKNL